MKLKRSLKKFADTLAILKEELGNSLLVTQIECTYQRWGLLITHRLKCYLARNYVAIDPN